MDIVEYVEQFFNIHLLDYQKNYIREIYDSVKNGGKFYYIPARGQTRFDFYLLCAMIAICAGKEKLNTEV